jgi:hypothetical protein
LQLGFPAFKSEVLVQFSDGSWFLVVQTLLAHHLLRESDFTRSPFSVLSTWFSSPLPIFLFDGVDSVKLGAGLIQQPFGSVVASRQNSP